MSCQKHFDGQFIFMWNAFGAAMRNAFECLNKSGAATFSQFVTKICDADQSEDLTKGVGDVYPCRTINTGCVLMVFDNRMM